VLLTFAGTVVVSTVMWGSRKTLVPPLREDWTEPGSCWSSEPMLLTLAWDWDSSAMVLRETSELCLLGLWLLSLLLRQDSFFSSLRPLLSFGRCGFSLNLGGEGSGVAGGRQSASPEGSTWLGGPTITSSTGRNTSPLKRPSRMRASSTRKKYLQVRV
jgi:hypothetical protein